LNPVEFVSCAALVVMLLGLAVYFAWRQRQTLKSLHTQPNLSAEERRYLRNQAWRRLVCAGLMVVFAGLLAGWFFLEPPVRRLANQGEAAKAADQERPLNPDEKRLVHQFTFYWIGALLVLMALLALAAMDLWAIGRFGLRQQRQIQADCRAMLESHAARLRSQRNGHG
jgi:hypothetical protein